MFALHTIRDAGTFQDLVQHRAHRLLLGADGNFFVDVDPVLVDEQVFRLGFNIIQDRFQLDMGPVDADWEILGDRRLGHQAERTHEQQES